MASGQDRMIPDTQDHDAPDDTNQPTGEVNENSSESQRPQALPLHAHHDARKIVRLVQCSQCYMPLNAPVTLPCGNSLCRRCLPAVISNVQEVAGVELSRQEVVTCPFEHCGRMHAASDCNLDVTLTKVMEAVCREFDQFQRPMMDSPIILQEVPVASDDAVNLPPQSLPGGRLLATFLKAEMGQLAYDSGVVYLSSGSEQQVQLDVEMLRHVIAAASMELECHVCYGIILDPVTTSCGHTFCRRCLYRMLDHASACAICRREVDPGSSTSVKPSNRRLTSILDHLCPDLIAARAAAVRDEETLANSQTDTPLFVCTLSYPSMPTFLHIFEPRYRLMIRRALESGNRKFGMMMYNASGEPQGELGPVPFTEYGTLLHIQNVQMMADGRSLIETVGVSRFRVRSYGSQDGYIVGNVERLDDVSLAEEEQIEAAEMSGPPVPAHDVNGQLDRLSNKDLLEISTSFIGRMRASSAPWLHERVLAAYGDPPDDPGTFPFWFASVLPLAESEKYQLLPTTSVRDRLKIIARWVRRIEGHRW